MFWRKTIPVQGEFLVYSAEDGRFTVDLSSARGILSVEWMNPASGVKTKGADVAGGATRTFDPPFEGDAVLYLKSK